MKKSSLLLVEDDPDIREGLKLFLEMEGFEVHCAVHGREALDFFESGKKADVILLDLMMPVMSGYEFLDRFQSKEYESFSSIPIIILSATTNAAQVAQDKKIKFLKKPFDLDILLQMLV